MLPQARPVLTISKVASTPNGMNTVIPGNVPGLQPSCLLPPATPQCAQPEPQTILNRTNPLLCVPNELSRCFAGTTLKLLYLPLPAHPLSHPGPPGRSKCSMYFAALSLQKISIALNGHVQSFEVDELLIEKVSRNQVSLHAFT
jgi:hypothetical protein